MTALHKEIGTILDIVAGLKDDVVELQERHKTGDAGTAPQNRSRIAPGHTPEEAWSPCDQREVQYYASLTYLH